MKEIYDMSLVLQGDSGGPLVCKNIAVGIVSFHSNNDCKSSKLPYVYTKISTFLPWIHSIIGNMEWDHIICLIFLMGKESVCGFVFLSCIRQLSVYTPTTWGLIMCNPTLYNRGVAEEPHI